MKQLKRIFPFLVLLLALGFTVYGLLDGGFSDVLNKARMICYECIGIG